MIGEVVGQYKITEKLGDGGMGSVYKGLDLMLQREVAIKMLRPEIARQPELVERFRSEAITLAKLNNPGIATLYNFFQHREDFFMVMEFVQGRTLENVIRAGAMPWERAVPMFIMILESIQPAHSANILHRDVKPANIMVTNWGTIKVMDFGIARVLGTARVTREGRMVGTIEYIAPERIKGNEADVRADIYSLGVVLYEMLSGRLPFESPSEFEIMRGHIQESPPPFARFVAGVPSPIEAVVMKSLAKAPEQRFQTCSEFIVALQNAMQYVSNTRPRTDPNLGFRPELYGNAPLKATVMAEVSGPANRMTDDAVRPTFAAASTAMDAPAYAEPKATRYEPAFQPPPLQTPPLQPPPFQPPPVYNNPGLPGPATPQFAPPNGSPLKKLDWRHYTAAAGLLVLLVGGALFAFRGGNHVANTEQPVTKPRASEPQPSPVGAPSSQTSSTPAPSGDPAKASVPADKPVIGRPVDLPTVLNSGESDTEKAAAAARARAEAAERKRKLEDALNAK